MSLHAFNIDFDKVDEVDSMPIDVRVASDNRTFLKFRREPLCRLGIKLTVEVVLEDRVPIRCAACVSDSDGAFVLGHAAAIQANSGERCRARAKVSVVARGDFE